MKKILGALLALTMALGAFAFDAGLYGKLNAGWSDGWVSIDKSGFNHAVDYHGFELFPALGICPEATSVPSKPFDFTFEASLGLIFGSSGEYNGVEAKVINPGVTCFFNWHFENTDSTFLKNFVPYGGAGISTPIQFVKVEYWNGWWQDSDGVYRNHYKTVEDTTLGIDLTFVVGARYAFTEKFEVNAETGWNTGIVNGMGGWFTRGGVMYRFK